MSLDQQSQYLVLFHLFNSYIELIYLISGGEVSFTYLLPLNHFNNLQMTLFMVSQIMMKENPRKSPKAPPNSARKDENV